MTDSAVPTVDSEPHSIKGLGQSVSCDKNKFKHEEITSNSDLFQNKELRIDKQSSFETSFKTNADKDTVEFEQFFEYLGL